MDAASFRPDPGRGALFLLLAPAPQIIQVFFHELLAFDLFLFATLSLSISLLKISQEPHLYHSSTRTVINLSHNSGPYGEAGPLIINPLEISIIDYLGQPAVSLQSPRDQLRLFLGINGEQNPLLRQTS